MPRVPVESILKTYPDQAALVRLTCGHERIVVGTDVKDALHWCEVCETPRKVGSVSFIERQKL